MVRKGSQMVRKGSQLVRKMAFYGFLARFTFLFGRCLVEMSAGLKSHRSHVGVLKDMHAQQARTLPHTYGDPRT